MTDQGISKEHGALAVKLSARDLLSPLAIIIAGLMISGSIIWSSRPPLPPQVAGQESIAPVPPSDAVASPMEPAQLPGPPADIAKVNLKGEPFIGDANAPVVIAYWFDYQCPFFPN